MSELVFRKDINGLRAFSVLAVVFFHFGIPGFGGGFIGVDIFFLISGFLMTGILCSGLGLHGRGFSITNFYISRAVRIVPALSFLCAVLLFLGWFFVLAPDLKALGTHVLFSIIFLSNFKLWREAGYFDDASHEKWLLHTWSLSVEWQFYLLFPLFLSLVWYFRPGRKSVFVFISIFLIISFISSVVGARLAPVANFYMLHSRAWEMLAGGLVFLLLSGGRGLFQERKWLEFFSFLLLILSVFLFDENFGWPSWGTIVPIVGAAGVLFASRSDSLITGNAFAQWVGTRSYSLYLWHWPVVVALNYFSLLSDTLYVAVGLIAAFVLGELSYTWVENPVRSGFSRIPRAKRVFFLIGVTLLVAGVGLFFRIFEGFPRRFSPDIEAVRSEAFNGNSRNTECNRYSGYTSPSCIYGSGALVAIVLGDSHADALVTSVSAAAGIKGSVMQWSYSGCPSIDGVTSVIDNDVHCKEFMVWASDRLSSVPKTIPIIIINRSAFYAVGPNEDPSKLNIPTVYFNRRYSHSDPSFLKEYSDRLVATTCRLARDRVVYLVRPIPEMGVNVPRTARFMVFRRDIDVSISLDDYHRRQSFVWDAQNYARDHCGVRILDPLPYLCRDGRCFGKSFGRPIYYDDDHLSDFGNKLLVPMFSPIFRRGH